METIRLRDIIGPIMVGPSSSHTAGALAIARMARNLCGGKPVSVRFTLYGSFAHTGSGHGTDKALVAGILGCKADDLAIRTSFDLAEQCGLDVSFDRVFDEGYADHPNTVDIHLVDDTDASLDVRGISVGGGAAVITLIDGIDVDITGEHTSVVVCQQDERGVLAHIASCLAECGVNIATTRMYRTKRGATAYTVMETDDAVSDEVKNAIASHPAVKDVRVVAAASAVDDAMNAREDNDETPSCRQGQSGSAEPAESPYLSYAGTKGTDEAVARYEFTTGRCLLLRCEENGCGIPEVIRGREAAYSALDGRDPRTDEYLERALDIMGESARLPLTAPEASIGGLIGGEAHRMRTNARGALLDPLSESACILAMAVLETNAAMGRIVAAPTAGSAGVVPGVLLALEEHRGFDRETLKRGLLVASAIGYLIARNASVSGAEGGCQAEIGSAAAMAAAAAVEMAGGTPAQALEAASNALTCLMGLVCDPIGGLVEIPCQKRNATAALTALSCAQIALSGTKNLVGFDETVAAMNAVGRSLPFELRESALGGIAATPSACAWCNARKQKTES